MKLYQKETLPSPRVVLNPADCDLDFIIERDGVVGYRLNEEGFSYCWSGARANVGITGGKYCFGCKIVSEQHVVMDDIAREEWHLCHVGVSRGDDTIGSLYESESKVSMRGKIPNDGLRVKFWTDLDVGETIICCVDLERKPKPLIGFFQNGISLGVTCRPDVAGGSALFPHVVLKNIKIEMQFGVEDGLVPQKGFKPWALNVADGNGVMGPILSTRPSECEVIIMVGLPASGKTTWAKKAVKERPEKGYVLLGIDSILHDKMKVPLERNNDDYGRFHHRATEIFNRMLSMAATIPRNYIIDDRNNVYLNTRKDTLKSFADFHKIAVIVVPEQGEFCIRFLKQKAEPVPFAIRKELVANFFLPKSNDMPDTDEYFDEVIFAELNREESQKELDYMKGRSRANENVNKLKNLEH